MKILLIDDHILFREGLASLLDAQPEFHVVGSTNSVDDAIVQTKKLQPDLVILNFDLLGTNGHHFTNAFLKRHPLINVIFLVVQGNDVSTIEKIDHGHETYLPKNIPVSELLDHIHELRRSNTSFSRSNIAN
jgi:DNA-binding NarL/FixJ family response regulator